MQKRCIVLSFCLLLNDICAFITYIITPWKYNNPPYCTITVVVHVVEFPSLEYGIKYFKFSFLLFLGCHINCLKDLISRLAISYSFLDHRDPEDI